MQEFPPRLELLVTNRQRFQFELQGFNHVIMIVSRPDEDSILFQCFLNQLQIYQITHPGKPGETVTIIFPTDVLQQIRSATALKATQATPVTTPATDDDKATPDVSSTGTSSVDSTGTKKVPSKDNRSPRQKPSNPTSTLNSAPNNNTFKRNQPSRQTINPDNKIGRTLTEENEITIPWISKTKPVEDNDKDAKDSEKPQSRSRDNEKQQPQFGQTQTRAYRDAVNNNFYPLSREFRADPLHIWYFHLTLSNMAVSILPIDTHLEKYEDPSVFRAKVFRQLYKMKHYEELLCKHMKENPQEDAQTVPVEGQENATTLRVFSRSPLKKLLRLGIPANSPIALLRLLNDCKSYANQLGINLLVDRIRY